MHNGKFFLNHVRFIKNCCIFAPSKPTLTIANDEETVCQCPWTSIVGILREHTAAKGLYLGTDERRQLDDPYGTVESDPLS